MTDAYNRDFQFPPEKNPAPADDRERPNSGLAVTSLVFGILGFLPLPGIGSIIAIVTGMAALGQIREEGGRVGGRSMAKVGLVLGSIQIAILAIAAALLFPYLSPGDRTDVSIATRIRTMTAETRGIAAGVKMVNEMDRGDHRLIEESKLDLADDEIIACYDAGKVRDDPEFALLTNHQIVYFNEGRKIAFDLKDVVELKDDRAYELAYNMKVGGLEVVYPDSTTYHIEVRLRSGPRMRVDIRPEEQGSVFFDALDSAWKAAGGKPDPAKGK